MFNREIEYVEIFLSGAYIEEEDEMDNFPSIF